MEIRKRIVSLMMVLLFLMSIASGPILATNGNKKQFKDVKEGHYAYKSIKLMVSKGILSGYNDGNFKPDNYVTRAEFAKMMVLTLGLDLKKPSKPFFADVTQKNWEYPYIETAKSYLTGWRIGDHYYYRSNEYAVREDMAVAIVKGLGFQPETDLGVLEQYKDSSDINYNLKKFVAKAINEGVMIGSKEESNKYFKPQDYLKRADAAVLLARLIDEEKVTFDDEKVVIDDEDEADEVNEELTPSNVNKTPEVKSNVTSEGIELTWYQTPKSGFKYYKVVLSKYNSSPSYPDDGYVTYISDYAKTRYFVHSGQDYHGGDVDTIQSGKSYYITITAVYDDGKYTSNVLRLNMP